MNRSLKRIVHDFRRHPWIHMISITTLAIALFILGGFFLLSRNVQHVAEAPGAETSGTLYLKAGLSETEINTLKDRLHAKPIIFSFSATAAFAFSTSACLAAISLLAVSIRVSMAGGL